MNECVANNPLLQARVQSEPIDTAAELTQLQGPGAGAVVSFCGKVRDADDGSSISALELEHYPQMTENAMHEILDLAAARWPLCAARIVHRVGRMVPEDIIVLVITAAEHRGAAFAACEFLMDYLKTRVPLWKCETTAEGKRRWVEARSSDTAREQYWQKSSRSI